MSLRRAGLPGLAVALALAGCVGASPTPKPVCPTQAPGADQVATILDGADRAVVLTSKGDFSIALHPDAAPIAVANFAALARCGFYDGITFHRIIPGFVAQAGDPQTKGNHDDFAELGTGGPGYRFTIEAPAEGLNYDPYVVAMANSGQPDSNGSQFFVNLDDLDGRLERLYTIIGMVEAGTDVVDTIGGVPTSARDVPLDPVVIETIRLEGGAAASPGA